MDPLTEIPEASIECPCRTGDPHARYNIYERVCDSAQQLQPSGTRGWRDQWDVAHSLLSAALTEADGLLGREIADNEAVNAGRLAVLYKLLVAVCQDGVVVAHEEDGDLEALGAGIADNGEGCGDRNTVEEGDSIGLLDSRSVGDWVGEWETELDEVWM